MIERELSSKVTYGENISGNLTSKIEKGQEFLQRIDELTKLTGGKPISLFNFGKSLGFKVYESAKVVRNSGLIRGIARKLGIPTADDRKPLFSREEARRIAIELASTEIPQEKKRGRRKKIKEVPAITASIELSKDKSCKILPRGEVIFFGITNMENEMLRILAEASEENPISGYLLARKMYGDEVKLKIAKRRISAMFPGLRRKLEEYDLTIAAKNTGLVRKGKDRISYYLVDKNSYVRRERLLRKSVKSKIPVEEDIFVAKMEIENQKLETPMSDASILNKSPNAENRLDSNILLNDNEIYVIVKRLSNMQLHPELKALLMELQINIEPLDTEEIRSLSNRTRVKVEKEFKKGLEEDGQNILDFEKNNILSARKKFAVFVKNPEEYLKLCGVKAQILLSCFDFAKIGDGFWEKLLVTQRVPDLKVMAKMVI